MSVPEVFSSLSSHIITHNEVKKKNDNENNQSGDKSLLKYGCYVWKREMKKFFTWIQARQPSRGFDRYDSEGETKQTRKLSCALNTLF